MIFQVFIKLHEVIQEYRKLIVEGAKKEPTTIAGLINLASILAIAVYLYNAYRAGYAPIIYKSQDVEMDLTGAGVVAGLFLILMFFMTCVIVIGKISVWSHKQRLKLERSQQNTTRRTASPKGNKKITKPQQ